MKRSLLLNLLLAVALVTGGAVGCKRKPKTPTPIPAQAGQTGNQGPYGIGEPMNGSVVKPAEPIEVGPVGEGDVPGQTELTGGMDDWVADATFFSANTVHFGFDRSTIRVEDRPNVEAVGQHLLANPNNGVRVEGHCDERGTEGYNLALGERRALAIREYLLNMGVSPNRVDTISYGESRPVDFGTTEDAYQRNRRGEFLLMTPP